MADAASWASAAAVGLTVSHSVSLLSGGEGGGVAVAREGGRGEGAGGRVGLVSRQTNCHKLFSPPTKWRR